MQSTDQLRLSLLSHFHRYDGGWTCVPLGRTHYREGQSFLVGYAAVWGVPTDVRHKCGLRLIIEQGAFRDVLGRTHCTALINHSGALVSLGNTTDGTLALLEDDCGLAAFMAPPSDRGISLMACEAVVAGKLKGMSFLLEALAVNCTHENRNGIDYQVVNRVHALSEVSIVQRPACHATTVLCINPPTAAARWRWPYQLESVLEH